MKNNLQWNEAVLLAKKGDINGFEVIYILTYKSVGKRILSIVKKEEYLWDLLYHIYIEVNQRIMEMPEGARGKEWIILLAEEWSYKLLEEKGTQSDNDTKKNLINEEKAATVLLKIEEELGILKEKEKETNKFIVVIKLIVTISLICICLFFVHRIYVIAKKNSQVNNNFTYEIRRDKASNSEDDKEIIENLIVEEHTTAEDNTEADEIVAEEIIKIESGWGIDDDGFIFLIDENLLNVIGNYENETHKFYFDDKGNMAKLSNKLGDYKNINDTIQISNNWIYYLIPNSQDGNYDLYRVLESDQAKSWKEHISNNISDYYIADNILMFMKNNKLEIITDISDQSFLVKEQQLDLVRQEDGFYIVNELGNIVNEDLKDTHMQVGDRIYRIKEGKVKYVKQNILPIKGVTYYLNSSDSYLYWKNTKGENGRFVGEGVFINSFCIVDQWVYYSVCIREESNKRYSQIRRISTDGIVREDVSGEFQGNMLNMYYYQEKGEIYAEYIPEKSQYGKVAVISLNGTISVIDDSNERTGTNTTGEDMLEIITVKEQDVYCYWHDCDWRNRNGVQILWTKPVIISNNNKRVLVP